MQFKDNVNLGFFKYINHFLDTVDRTFQAQLGHDAFMTSANDSQHSAKSLHYKHRAWDFRIREDNSLMNYNYQPHQLRTLVRALQANLGAYYQVILESDHIHVEYDPKDEA